MYFKFHFRQNEASIFFRSEASVDFIGCGDFRALLLRFLEMFLYKGESGVGNFAPTVVDDKRVAPAGNFLYLGHTWIVLLLLERGMGIDHGTVLSFSPEMISSGPRSGFLVSTWASV